MRLIPHAWTTIKHAWSVRLMGACVLLMLVEPVISGFVEEFVTGQSFWTRVAVKLLIAVVGILAIWARVTFQSTLQEKITEKESADNAKQQG